jgi:hypothetical protein
VVSTVLNLKTTLLLSEDNGVEALSSFLVSLHVFVCVWCVYDDVCTVCVYVCGTAHCR